MKSSLATMTWVKKWGRLLLINLLALGLFFLLANLVSPYLFKRLFSEPGAYPYLPDGIRRLIQTSSSSLLPDHYIAIAGDSYAVGFGDWLDSQHQVKEARYSAAHLLQRATGRDVLSFGAAGAGSVRGLVGEPMSLFQYLDKTLFFALNQPDIIFAYFYEGNDLADNLEYIQSADKCIKKLDQSQKGNSDYLQRYIGEVALESNQLHEKIERFSLSDNLFLLAMAKKITSLQKPQENKDYPQCSPYSWLGRTVVGKDRHYNRVLINGQQQVLPDRLQGPATDLNESQTAFAFAVFEQSLKLMKRYFNDSDIVVVYIPSVLSSYELLADEVSTQPYLDRQQEIVSANTIYPRSNQLAARVLQISQVEGVGFVDARPAIREVARQQMIHGPRDWNHFNRAGYEALAGVLQKKIEGVHAD